MTIRGRYDYPNGKKPKAHHTKYALHSFALNHQQRVYKCILYVQCPLSQHVYNTIHVRCTHMLIFSVPFPLRAHTHIHTDKYAFYLFWYFAGELFRTLYFACHTHNLCIHKILIAETTAAAAAALPMNRPKLPEPTTTNFTCMHYTKSTRTHIITIVASDIYCEDI